MRSFVRGERQTEAAAGEQDGEVFVAVVAVVEIAGSTFLLSRLQRRAAEIIVVVQQPAHERALPSSTLPHVREHSSSLL